METPTGSKNVVQLWALMQCNMCSQTFDGIYFSTANLSTMVLASGSTTPAIHMHGNAFSPASTTGMSLNGHAIQEEQVN